MSTRCSSRPDLAWPPSGSWWPDSPGGPGRIGRRHGRPPYSRRGGGQGAFAGARCRDRLRITRPAHANMGSSLLRPGSTSCSCRCATRRARAADMDEGMDRLGSVSPAQARYGSSTCFLAPVDVSARYGRRPALLLFLRPGRYPFLLPSPAFCPVYHCHLCPFTLSLALYSFSSVSRFFPCTPDCLHGRLVSRTRCARKCRRSLIRWAVPH